MPLVVTVPVPVLFRVTTEPGAVTVVLPLPVLVTVLPLVGAVLIFLLAFIAVYMA